MSQSAIAAHQEGDRVAIETHVKDPDFNGTVNISYLDADAAIRFGEGLARLGRRIKQAARAPLPEGKVLRLTSRSSDPHAEDRG